MDSTVDRSLTAREAAVEIVHAALRAASAPLRLSELATATGLEVSLVSLALAMLEQEGAVQFRCGQWRSRASRRQAGKSR